MRVIALKTLKRYIERRPDAALALMAWYQELTKAEWKSPQALKQQYRNASVLSGKRVVFNIHGNTHRLIVDIEYRLGIVFIVWVGTHQEYDRIDASTISYDQAD